MQDTTLVISDVEQSVTLVISDVVSLNDYIPKSIINAKGDLIVGGENGEPIRFPTGETNQFLVVDPIENSGYKFTNLFNDLGDIIFGGAGGETVILPGNNTTTKKFLSQTGTGVNSDAVIWDRIAVDDVPILNQNTTGIASAAAILINPRSINGVNFDGSADITINAIDSTPRIALSEKGVANGVATLGVDGLIPTTQLPSYIDDVLEFNNLSMFPVIGEIGKIYVALDTNKVYRWSGSVYIFITSGAVDSVAGKTGVVALNKNDVGLGSVDNTSDLSKPISTATQTALDLKANLASPTFTGTVSGITKAMVGLANVDNTTDLLKPISTATQTALDNKANIFSPVFLGNVGINKTIPAYRLDVVGEIQGTQVHLINPATLASHSVRADRTIGTTAPLTGGGDLTANRNFGLSFNTTNLRITSNALNTIQDIGVTSTPTFTGVNLNGINNDAFALPPTAMINGAYISIGDLSGGRILPNGMGIKFADSGAAHASIHYLSSNQTINFGRSRDVSHLQIDSGATAITMDLANLRFGINRTLPAATLDVGGSGIISGTLTVNGLGNNYFAGNVGYGTINPTATVHLKAGTATAGTAPLKFISGTLLTSPEVGVFEYNNTLHFTNSDAVRRNVVVSDQSYTAGAVAVGGRVRMRIGGTEYNVLVE